MSRAGGTPWLLWAWLLAAAGCLGPTTGTPTTTRPAGLEACTTQPAGGESTWRRAERRKFLAALRWAEKRGRLGWSGPRRLLEILDGGDSEQRRATVERLARLGWRATEAVEPLAKDLDHADWSVRCDAVEALAVVGPAREVTGHLLKALGDPEAVVRAVAAEALGRLRPARAKVAEALAGRLRDSDAWVRRSAGWGLARMGRSARSAVPALIAALRDADGDVRHAAVLALGAIGPADHETVKALVQAAGDGRDDAKEAAAWALGRAGPLDKASIAMLTDLLEVDQAHVGTRAAEALACAGPAAAPAVGGLIKLLARGDTDARVAAAETLARIGPAAGEALATLAEVWSFLAARPRGRIDDADAALRLAVVRALGRIDADRSAGELLAATRDASEPVRLAGLAGLARCGRAAAGSARALAGALAVKDHPGAAAAERVLLRIGAVAVPALVKRLDRLDCAPRVVGIVERIDPNGLRPLVRRLDGPDVAACLRAAEVLSHSRRFGKAAVPYLIEELRGGTVESRKKAVRALSRIGRDAAAGLLRGASDRDGEVRRLAIEGLGRARPAGADAAAAAVRGLKDRELAVRWSAAEALGRMAAGSPAAVGALTAALRDEHGTVRWRAAEALGRIGPPARASAGALQAAMGDGDGEVRAAAKAALAKVRGK